MVGGNSWPAARLIVTGGNTPDECPAAVKNCPTNRTWVLSLTQQPSAALAWTHGPRMPEAVRRHTVTLVEDAAPTAANQRPSLLVVIAGSHGPSCEENLTAMVASIPVGSGEFQGGWTVQRTGGEALEPRMGHVAVSPPGSGAVVVIGGQQDNFCAESGFSNDVHALDTLTWTWTRLTPAGVPPRPRYGHTAWWLSDAAAPAGGGVQITGGTCGTACGACLHANDTFVLHLPNTTRERDWAGMRWVQTQQGGHGPSPRDRHTSVRTGRDGPVLDYGGFVAHSIDSNTVFAFDPKGDTGVWTPKSVRGSTDATTARSRWHAQTESPKSSA